MTNVRTSIRIVFREKFRNNFDVEFFMCEKK